MVGFALQAEEIQGTSQSIRERSVRYHRLGYPIVHLSLQASILYLLRIVLLKAA